MIDIQFIRDNPDLVAEKSRHKGYDVDITQLLGFDTERRELQGQVEELRRQRNEIASSMKGKKPSEEQVTKGRELKDKLADLEHKFNSVEQEFNILHNKVPNMPADDVPVGASEEENQVSKTVGKPTEFDFEPKSHWEIGESRGWIDKARAAKVTGSRFAYLQGDLVKLQFAIIQFVLDTLSDTQVLEKIANENKLNIQIKPFVPILPPVMIREDIYDQMDRLEPREDRYHIEGDDDNLWLIGSAEHTLGSMFADEIIPEPELPLRYIGYSTSFRQEAGTYGKDNEGILRMHQFDKLEMEVFSTSETGPDEHLFLIAIQEYLMQQLGIPYQVLSKCTADIGKPNARGIDIEAWMPGQNKYRETHTADFMTDYQSRRLKTRTKHSDGNIALVHTNDATAFALGRTMIAIIENFQTVEEQVSVPAVLRPYMAGKSVI